MRSRTQRQKERAGAALTDLFGQVWLHAAAIEEQRALAPMRRDPLGQGRLERQAEKQPANRYPSL
jgi:hypothetical protein